MVGCANGGLGRAGNIDRDRLALHGPDFVGIAWRCDRRRKVKA